MRNVRAAWLLFQPSHLFVLSTAEQQPNINTFLNEHLLWFNFSKPYLHTLTSPFPGIIMVRGGHRRHILEPVNRIFVTMSSSNVLKRRINLVYLALVYATNKHTAELQREPSCSNISQFAVIGGPLSPSGVWALPFFFPSLIRNLFPSSISQHEWSERPCGRSPLCRQQQQLP